MRKPILYNVILAGLIIVGFMFLLFPLYEKVGGLKAKLEKRSEELQNKEKYFSKLNKLKQQLDGFKEEVVKIESSLPQEADILDVVNFISSLSSRNGLIMKSVTISKASQTAETKGVVKRTSLNIGLSGSYEALKNFLSELQKSSRLIEVDSISFESTPKQERSRGEVNNFLEFNIAISFPSY